MNQLLSSIGLSSTEPLAFPTATQLPGVIVGMLLDVTASGEPIVRLPDDNSQGDHVARSVVPIDRGSVGSEAVLVFENGNPERPIILGLLRSNQPTTAPQKLPLNVTVDNERVEISAEQEIVLKCGKASITLTRAGKVLIRGAYLLSRSSGVNRIKGGSVQIN